MVVIGKIAACAVVVKMHRATPFPNHAIARVCTPSVSRAEACDRIEGWRLDHGVRGCEPAGVEPEYR